MAETKHEELERRFKRVRLREHAAHVSRIRDLDELVNNVVELSEWMDKNSGALVRESSLASVIDLRINLLGYIRCIQELSDETREMAESLLQSIDNLK